MTWVIFTAVALLIALTSGPGLFAASTWAEKRWEARFDACGQSNSYVLIKSPDDQECAVLCGLLPTPKLIPLPNGSICMTSKKEPGTCNRGECFAREMTPEEALEQRASTIRPGRKTTFGRRIIDP
ncbi:uncharacterized protein LOC111269048 [Varroa jacobsoni]|uniref:uncharacterized protein LOC111269048 n=1 Tax=Varroa jacobsoni TaxID=62625 RepID=UPI000BF94E31|nr:uncharacterized protein LOC111269048 [Varroa jacobsoni]